MKAMGGTVLLAFVVYGCGATPDAALLEDAEQAEEGAVPAAGVTEDLYVEFMAQQMLLTERYEENPWELTRRLQGLSEELAVEGAQLDAFMRRMMEDMEEFGRIMQRIEERFEELRE